MTQRPGTDGSAHGYSATGWTKRDTDRARLSAIAVALAAGTYAIDTVRIAQAIVAALPADGTDAAGGADAASMR